MVFLSNNVSQQAQQHSTEKDDDMRATKKRESKHCRKICNSFTRNLDRKQQAKKPIKTRFD